VIPQDPWSKKLRKKLRKLLGPDLPPTEGGCWIVADAMLEAWGGDLGCVWDEDQHYREVAHHAFLELPDGRLVDGDGVQSPDAMLAKAEGWDGTFGPWLGPFSAHALLFSSTPPPFEGKKRKKLIGKLRKLGPPPVAGRNPPRCDYGRVAFSDYRGSQGKKRTAVFTGPGRRRTVHFGAQGYEDYTMHHDPERRRRYVERHGRGREDWDRCDTAGSLSRWVLWGDSTSRTENERAFRRRFGINPPGGPDDRARRLERAWSAGDPQAGWELARELARQGADERVVVPIIEQIPGWSYYGLVEYTSPHGDEGIERWDHPQYGPIFVRGYWDSTGYCNECSAELTTDNEGRPHCLSCDGPLVEGNPPSALQRVRRAVGRKRECYPAAEVVYHANGGRRAGYTPVQQRHEGRSHWWVRGPGGEVLDPAAAQFRWPVPYERGRGRGFLTKRPSKRARALARRAKVRINPRPAGDRGMRELERQVASGDPLAEQQLERIMVSRAGLTPDELFFFEHSGYSYPSGAGVMGRIEAKIGWARRSAAALEEVERRGWIFEWNNDELCDNEEGVLYYHAGLRDEHGEPLAGLGCIGMLYDNGEPWDTYGRHPYYRVVESDLALEALAEVGENPRRLRRNMPKKPSREYAQGLVLLSMNGARRVKGKGHPKYRLPNGKLVVGSNSPSDHRAGRNFLGDVRRSLRQMEADGWPVVWANPSPGDRGLRELERAWKAGDPAAMEALVGKLRQRGDLEGAAWILVEHAERAYAARPGLRQAFLAVAAARDHLDDVLGQGRDYNMEELNPRAFGGIGGDVADAAHAATEGGSEEGILFHPYESAGHSLVQLGPPSATHLLHMAEALGSHPEGLTPLDYPPVDQYRLIRDTPWAILRWNNDGHRYADFYDTEEEARQEWGLIELDYQEDEPVCAYEDCDEPTMDDFTNLCEEHHDEERGVQDNPRYRRLNPRRSGPARWPFRR
jgi:hypothetical protein